MRIAIVLAALLLLPPAAAQQHQEEQTREYEERDSQYFERYVEKSAEESTEDFAERADDMIRDRNYRSAVGEHYRVQSDDPRLDAEAALELLEAFRSHFDDFWSGRITLAPCDQETSVFLFYSSKKYNDLLPGDSRYSDSHPGVIALHTDAESPLGPEDRLVHEAAHELINCRIYGAKDPSPSPWISQGLSSYFGLTYQDSSGAFIASEAGGKGILLTDDRRVRPRAGINRALKAARKSLQEAERDGYSAFRRLLSRSGEIKGESHFLSWVLVHYLLHGNGGAGAKSFIRCIELDREGDGRPEDLLRELSMSYEELEAAVASHLKTIKVR